MKAVDEILSLTDAANELRTTPSCVGYYVRTGRLAPMLVTRSGKLLFSLQSVLKLKKLREQRRKTSSYGEFVQASA